MEGKNIILVEFMGCGKRSIGKKQAKMLVNIIKEDYLVILL